MRKKTYLCMACLAAVLFCTVQCTDEDFMTPPRQAEVEGFTLEEAKTLFREEAAKYSATSRSLEDDSRVTLSPGDFVPEWEKATAAVQNGLACYNVPITGTTYRFKALAVEQRGNLMQASQVNVYQKLVIVKNLQTGNKSQYILTLIPDPSYAARHASGIAESFVNCGGKDGYSGLAVYTCVYTQIAAHVSRYKDGKRIQKIFLLDVHLKRGELRNAYELARSMTASVSILRGKAATTRFEDWGWDIDGGEIPEIEIRPDDNYDEPDWDSWLDETRPDDNYEGPEPEGPTEDTAEDQYTGGDDNNNDNVQQPILDQNLKNILNWTNMNQTQVDKLESAVNILKNTSIGSHIYQLLINVEAKMDFLINPMQQRDTFFNKGNNSINFKSEANITLHAVREELIHAVQYNAFYGESMSSKNSNYDFEAKVIADINTNKDGVPGLGAGTVDLVDNIEYCAMYESFINDFAYDNAVWDSEKIEIYNQLGSIWTMEQDDDIYDGTFDANISPKLLIELLK